MSQEKEAKSVRTLLVVSVCISAILSIGIVTIILFG